MKTTMYVITHKKAKVPKINGYKTLLVGADFNKPEGRFHFKDNTGDNISGKNKNYCELTGLYWIWKNTNDDIVGLCHYRRYFVPHGLVCNEKNCLGIDEIQSIMNKYDVIMPQKMIYPCNCINMINYAPSISDMKEVGDALKALYPEYLPEFRDFLMHNTTYYYNMCVMKRKHLDAYCKWLFDILEYVEVRHDMDKETDDYRKRLYGFLSERLLFVWLKKNISADKIYEVKVINSEEKINMYFRHELRKKLNTALYRLNNRKKLISDSEKKLLKKIL